MLSHRHGHHAQESYGHVFQLRTYDRDALAWHGLVGTRVRTQGLPALVPPLPNTCYISQA
jgi:hypothetical protein